MKIMYVCVCNAVTDSEIREAYAEGACNFEALQDELGVATCCGCCEPIARQILATCQAAEGHAAASPGPVINWIPVAAAG